MDNNDDIKNKVTEIKAVYGREGKGEKPSDYRAYLVVIEGWEEGLEFEIEDFPAFIGRDESCHVTIPLPSVSREHAIISFN